MKRIKIISDPKKEAYRKILDLAFNVCDEFILVKRNDEMVIGVEIKEGVPVQIIDDTYEVYNENAKKIFKNLKVFLNTIRKQFIYPLDDREYVKSSCRTWKEHDVHYYKINSQIKDIIENVTDSLFSWHFPNLPDDLCFLKNGNPWLTNIAHEKIGFFDNLTIEEFKILKNIDGLEFEELEIKY